MPRPNAAPRPVCRYYNTSPRGCFAGNKCHYVHGDPSIQKHTPYEENKTCRFFAQGYCKRGSECWFRHVEPEMTVGTLTAPRVEGSSEVDEDASCGICFEEKPTLYGLLSGCSHAFCLNCIRQWRDPEGKGSDMTDSGIHKTCPMCRTPTKFIVPSSRFYSQGDARKADVVVKYKQSMAKVPCRYFTRSKPSNRFCPFGRDCFYQHVNADGTVHEFTHGVDVMMMQWQRRRHGPQGSFEPLFRDPLQAALEVLEGFADTLASDRNGTNDPDTTRSIIDMHVRDMLRIMGHAPALQTLATLERMAGDDGESVQEETREEEVESRSATPRPSSAVAGAGEARSVAADEDDSSEDPRAPHNTSRSSELVTGDFAWMMEERSDENCT